VAERHYPLAKGHEYGKSDLRRPTDSSPRKPDVILCRYCYLFFVLVEIEGGVEFRLAGEQVLHTRFMIEGLVGLRLIIGQYRWKVVRGITSQTGVRRRKTLSSLFRSSNSDTNNRYRAILALPMRPGSASLCRTSRAWTVKRIQSAHRKLRTPSVWR
jgi:hypothetical protein